MKIAIDIRTVTPVRSGVGNYVLNLLEALRRVAPQHQYFLIGLNGNLETLGWSLEADQAYRTAISHESHPLGDMWEHCWLPRVLEKNRVDVLHGPATLIPLRQGAYASVVTVHDLVAFLFPETIPRKYAVYMRWLLTRVVKRADRIISVSYNTKEDLVRILGVEPEKITVVHEAAQPQFKPIKDRDKLEQVRRRYGIPGPFIYHVDNIEPRKNLVRLVKAFMLARKRLQRPVRLVITGQRGWLTGKLFRSLNGLDLGDHVIFTGYVPHGELPLLMNAAQAFVFPSLYEGFGLPVLEAMSCGTPVVTSNISSLPEIVGRAAVLVDPNDVESIASGMVRVLEDQGLRWRLSAEGLVQARRFSWNKAAQETLRVFLQAYLEKGV